MLYPVPDVDPALGIRAHLTPLGYEDGRLCVRVTTEVPDPNFTTARIPWLLPLED